METKTTSGKFSLNLNDILRGLLVAVIAAILPIITETIQNGSLTFDWKHILMTAIGAMLAYLIKNFFTPQEIVITDAPASKVQAVKEGAAEVKIEV